MGPRAAERDHDIFFKKSFFCERFRQQSVPPCPTFFNNGSEVCLFCRFNDIIGNGFLYLEKQTWSICIYC